MVPSALRTGLLVVLIAFLAAGGPAFAQTPDREADLRRYLDRTVDERDATLDTLSYLKSMQASERVYFMLPWWIDDDPLESAWGFLTRSEAIHAITPHAHRAGGHAIRPPGTGASHAELDGATSIIRTYATANDTQRG